MSVANNYLYIVAAACTLLPIIFWVGLRKQRHWPHMVLAWLSIAIFFITFFILETIYDLFLKSDCNDCEQGVGLATAVLLTPPMAIYTITALILTIAWLVRKIAQK